MMIEWIKNHQNKPLPFDENWWNGWKDYHNTHPDYQKMQWWKNTELKLQEFKTEFNHSKLTENSSNNKN